MKQGAKWTCKSTARVRNSEVEGQLKRNTGTREEKRRQQQSRGGAGNWGRAEPGFHMDRKMLMRHLVHAKCMTRGRWKQSEDIFLTNFSAPESPGFGNAEQCGTVCVEAASNLLNTFEHQLLELLRVCENKACGVHECISEGIEHVTWVVILESTTFSKQRTVLLMKSCQFYSN